jgi:O-antigen/teichoic acid export membrane protein
MMGAALAWQGQVGLFGMTAIALSGLTVSRLAGGLWLLLNERLSASAGMEAMRPVLSQAPHFLIAQVSDLLQSQGVPWVTLLVLGAVSAGPFSSAAKLVTLLPVAITLGTSPLIAAYADARAKGDDAWIGRTLVYSSAAACAAGIITFAVSPVLLPPLLQVWLGRHVSVPSPGPLAYLAGWAALAGIAAPLQAYCYGTGRTRQAVQFNLAATLTALAAAIYLRSEVGLAASLCLSQLALAVLPLAYLSFGVARR